MGRVTPFRVTPARAKAIAVVALVLATAACGLDDEQVRLCREAAAILDPAAAHVSDMAASAPEPGRSGVRLDYRAGEGGTAGDGRFVVCRFADDAFGLGRMELTAVESHQGRLSGMQLYWLRRVLDMGHAFVPRGGARGEMPALLPWLYLLQQVINAATVCCLYGLLAIGFTLVYGIIGKINLAFGEIFMIGAIVAMVWTKVMAGVGAAGVAAGLGAVLAVAMLTAACYGWMTHRVVFRPLHGATTQSPLIAAIGLALALREGTRLLHGAGNYWLRPPFPEVLTLAGNPAFPVTMTLSQAWILALTLTAYAGLALLLNATRFGRMQRACADDSRMAALLGVNVNGVVAGTFVVGSAAAGLAGFVVAQHYGVANFHMGVVLGFKALAAAVLGGIGSVGGAMLGGALIGLIETFWSAYLSLAYRDVAVFAILICVLVFRPQGLLGRTRD